MDENTAWKYVYLGRYQGLERLETLHRENPNATLQDAIADFQAATEEAKTKIQPDTYGICKKCGQEAVQPAGGSTAYHEDDNGTYLRGCRSASWTDRGGYNESFRPSWKATLT